MLFGWLQKQAASVCLYSCNLCVVKTSSQRPMAHNVPGKIGQHFTLFHRRKFKMVPVLNHMIGVFSLLSQKDLRLSGKLEMLEKSVTVLFLMEFLIAKLQT